MKAYKAFDKNLQCRGFQYEVGKTYETEGGVAKLCQSGFHACEKLQDCYLYYPEGSRICEVELGGTIVGEGGDKVAASKITLIRELNHMEILATRNSGKNCTGIANSGDYNSGHYNSGYANSGNRNSGNYNSGPYNSGHYNSGNRNSGNYNSGHYNSGNHNSGHYNSGNHNSGYYNSGNHNSGYYNSGNHNSGCFNTDEPTVRMFNKKTKSKSSEVCVPYVNLPVTRWISPDTMSAGERKTFPEGKLITLGYKEAWRIAWEDMSEETRNQFRELPNFCPKIFEEITGIPADSHPKKSRKKK